MSERSTGSVITFVVVFAAMLGLLCFNMWFYWDYPGYYLHNSVAVFVGLIQVSLVVLFFMHLIYFHAKLTWFFIGAGFFWLGILMVLTMSDYMTRTRPAGVNPKGEPVFLQEPSPALKSAEQGKVAGE